MVDLGAHCFPPATILDEDGAIWELVSPFLVIMEPASFVCGATEWPSYAVDLGEPGFSVAVKAL